jgi:hypothetical protein
MRKNAAGKHGLNGLVLITRNAYSAMRTIQAVWNAIILAEGHLAMIA